MARRSRVSCAGIAGPPRQCLCQNQPRGFRGPGGGLDARIPKLAQPQIRTGIQRLIASLGDAHTSIWWVRGTRLLPLGLYWFEDGIFVAAAAEPYRNPLGGRLVRVGRTRMEEACERLAALVPHENDAWLKAQLPASRASGQIDMRIGEVYRLKGDVENSLASLRRAREILPDHAKVMSALASVLDSAGRKQEAREAYEAGLKLDPNDGVILNNLAYLLSLKGGDLNVALAYAERARQVLPDLVEVSDTLAFICLKKDQPGEALGILRGVVQKAPGNVTFRYHLGMALIATGDRAGAMQAVQEALRSHPSAAEEKKIKALLQDLGQ